MSRVFSACRVPSSKRCGPPAAGATRTPSPDICEGTASVANIKSQIKRNRLNEEARARNRAVKSSLKTAVRRFREAAASGEAERARDAARVASRKLDKAASDGVIHKNQAANRKSAINKQAASL
jgi:small subunit ribosomal protein S20